MNSNNFAYHVIAKIVVIAIVFLNSNWLKAEEPEIKIGAIYGLTGFANIWSAQAKRGIDMAVKEINEGGGVQGRKIKVIYEDSASKPANAVTAFHKLVSVDKVEVVVGDVISFITMPLVPLAEHYKVVLVTQSIFDVEMPKDSKYVFTTCPRQKSIENPVRKFFEQNSKIGSVGILCADNEWGHAYLDAWSLVAKSMNVNIVDTFCTQDFSTDFKSELTRLKVKKPDAVIVAFAVDKVIRRMNELKFKVPVLTTSDIVEAVHFRGLPLEQTKGLYFNDWRAETTFLENFKRIYNEEAIMEPQNSYESIRTIAKGYEINKEDLASGIKKVKYQGVAGPIDFTTSNAGNYAEAKLFKSTGTEFISAE